MSKFICYAKISHGPQEKGPFLRKANRLLFYYEWFKLLLKAYFCKNFKLKPWLNEEMA